ncbi:MAG: hypothetical protein AB7N65_03980 [Vicinamibacterales bacterium]
MKRCLPVLLCVLWSSAAFAQVDAIDLSAAVVHNSPADVASWAVTTRISQMRMRPEGTANPGLSFTFPANQTWPNYTPPGWDGPIQYTVWAGVRINGVWHVSGIIQMWRERVATGAPLLTRVPSCQINGVTVFNRTNFACNWVYSSQWGAMMGYDPSPGEAMIFFLTAGNARHVTTVTSVRQRSNVVMVNLPANDNGDWTFPERRQMDILTDLGSQGIWSLNDSVSTTQLTAANPKDMVVGDLNGNGLDEVIVDFGGGVGVYVRWDTGAWVRLSTSSTNRMAVGDIDNNGAQEVILDFAGTGVQVFWNGSSLLPLHSLNTARLHTGDVDGGGADIILEYPGYGIWIRRNNSVWTQIHTVNTLAMAVGDFDGNGLDDIAVTFPNNGVWIYRNNSGWVQASGAQASQLWAGKVNANGRDDLVADFSPFGIWVYRDSASWSQLHSLSPRHVVLGDMDGNGQDEIIVNFGTGGGVWIWANDSTWIQAWPHSPENMAVGHLN